LIYNATHKDVKKTLAGVVEYLLKYQDDLIDLFVVARVKRDAVADGKDGLASWFVKNEKHAAMLAAVVEHQVEEILSSMSDESVPDGVRIEVKESSDE